MTERRLADFVEPLLAVHPRPHEVRLRLDAVRVRVRSNDACVAEALRAYCAPFVEHAEAPAEVASSANLGGPPLVVDVLEGIEPIWDAPLEAVAPLAGKKRVKDEIADCADGRVLRKRATGMWFAFNDERAVAAGPCRDNLNQVVNFINNRFMQRMVRGGCLVTHAAGVTRDGVGLGLAGISGAGKSTLALHLVASGYDFVSNDRLLVRPPRDPLPAAGSQAVDAHAPYQMVGVAKHPRVNPGTLLHNPRLASLLPVSDRRAYADLPEAELWNLEEKYDVEIESFFPESKFRLSSALRAFVLLTWSHDRGAEPRLARVDLRDRPELVKILRKPLAHHYYASRADAAHRPVAGDYQAALAGLPIFEISGGVDFAFAVERLRALSAELDAAAPSLG